MVVVAQLVRALVCGTKGRRFESGLPPKKQKPFKKLKGFFCGFKFYGINAFSNTSLCLFGLIVKND